MNLARVYVMFCILMLGTYKVDFSLEVRNLSPSFGCVMVELESTKNFVCNAS